MHECMDKIQWSVIQTTCKDTASISVGTCVCTNTFLLFLLSIQYNYINFSVIFFMSWVKQVFSLKISAVKPKRK